MATAVESTASVKTKGRILIVDDELVVRDSLGKWFTSEGYTARPVASGREALETIQQAEFDVALLDIKMPGMDGMELQGRLHEADPDLSVIIMTGYASVDTAVQALNAGPTITSPSPWIPMSFRTWWKKRSSTSARGARWCGCARTCRRSRPAPS